MEERFHESPASTEPAMKMVNPRMYTFLRPIVSPSLPQIGTKIAFARMYAVAIHPAAETVMPKSLMIFGSARLTMV